VIQLKSTLRPETPWEVSKRNEDIVTGIRQADAARAQLGGSVTAVVITDGYRGDYATWRVALDRRVATGTLEDLDEIARDPTHAFEILQERAGFRRAPQGEVCQDRTCDLVGWSLRLVDSTRD
jgi:hypothetical protein